MDDSLPRCNRAEKPHQPYPPEQPEQLAQPQEPKQQERSEEAAPTEQVGCVLLVAHLCPKTAEADDWHEPQCPSGWHEADSCKRQDERLWHDVSELRAQQARSEEQQAQLLLERHELAEARLYADTERLRLERALRESEEREAARWQQYQAERDRLRLQAQLLAEGRKQVEELQRELEHQRQDMLEQRRQLKVLGGPGFGSDCDRALDILRGEERPAAPERGDRRERGDRDRGLERTAEARSGPRFEHPFALRSARGAPPPRTPTPVAATALPDPREVFVMGCRRGTFHSGTPPPLRSTTPVRSASTSRLSEGLPVVPPRPRSTASSRAPSVDSLASADSPVSPTPQK